MPADLGNILSLLRKSHVFHSLTADELQQLISRSELVKVAGGQRIYRSGTRSETLYFLIVGRILLVSGAGNLQKTLACLDPGDFLGLESLNAHQPRLTTAVAQKECSLLRIRRSDLEELLVVYPSMKTSLSLLEESLYLRLRTRLDWLGKDETTYLLTRRSPLLLWQRLAFPLLVAVLCGLMAGYFLLNNPSAYGTGLVACLLGVILAGLAALWNTIDWGNDYYLLTNRRLVYLERVALLYDSRQETPLEAILSIALETSLLGRWFSYGNVVVRTYTGEMVLKNLKDPEEVILVLEEFWERAKNAYYLQEKQAVVDSIRGRLEPGAGPHDAGEKPENSLIEPGWFQRKMADIFRMRYKRGLSIVYRKHWFVLLKEIAVPSLGLLILVGVTIARLAGALAILPLSPTLVVTSIMMLAYWLWWLYRYLDWRNDMYMITDEQVIDSYKKPLGSEETRSAPLKNILSIEYKRPGIIGLAINMGTVVVRVGESDLTFENVYDPSEVQRQLFQRLAEQSRREKERNLEAERRRMVDFMEAYHQGSGEPAAGQKTDEGR